MPLIEFTDLGLFCPQGAFYVDPWRPVDKAVITHAHSDHARAGSRFYLCHKLTQPLLELRLGPHQYQSVEWGESVFLNGVKVSLHPAGHIIGSSQVRIEYQDEVWVVSGDYKTENDGISGAFEPIRCHTFVTESTFGLPIYNWKPQQTIFNDIQHWILGNKAEGKTSVLIAYSLGKAQRLLSCLPEVSDNIFLHGAVWNVHQALLKAGISLPEVKRVDLDAPKETFRSSVVIAPQEQTNLPGIKRFNPYEVGVCSGWMQVRGNQRRRNVDAGYALSDHADWNGLLSAIEATGAERVYATHGFQSALSRYLNEKGIQAAEVKTEYGEDEEAAPLPPGRGDGSKRMIETEMQESGMHRFAELVVLLGTSTKTNDKLDALTDYFATATDKDKVWLIALFSGRKPKRAVNSTQLQDWCRALTNLPQWLFEESYHTVGDLAETIALLLPERTDSMGTNKNLSEYLEDLIRIGSADEITKKNLHSRRMVHDGSRRTFCIQQTHHRRLPHRCFSKDDR